MKILNYFYSSLAVIFLLITSVSQLSALDRIDINNITNNNHYITVYFDANSNDPYQLDAIRIYEAEGYTKDESKFSIIREYDFTNYPNDLDSLNWNSQSQSLFTIKGSNFPIKKQMSYYMTAVSGQNESAFSDTVYYYYSEEAKDSIRFATLPPTKPVVKIGEKFEYDANAFSVMQSEVRYKLVNSKNNDASVNEDTGLFTFNATERGKFSFTIRAYLDDPTNYEDQVFNVTVVKCFSLITCNITLNNSIPEEISNGKVDIYMKTKDTLTFLTQSNISQNGFMFESLDEGEYKLNFRGTIGNSNISSWYEGKSNINNADFVQTKCDDTLNLTWNIEYINTSNFSIDIERISKFPQDLVKKGTIYEKQIGYTTNPKGEEVEFSLSDNSNFSLIGPNKDILSLNTDEAGIYEVFVLAKMKKYPNVKATNFVKVWVTECNELQTLKIDVKDFFTGKTVDKPIYGEIYSSGISKNDTTIAPKFIDSSYATNGILEFEVDKGSYYVELFVSALFNNQNKQYRYQYDMDKPVDEKVKIQDGKLLDVQCSNTNIEWEIRYPKEVKTYNISGNVAVEDNGFAIKSALVQLVGKNELTDKIETQTTYTNDNGYYNINATNDNEYVITATTTDSTSTRYLREYWKETSNASEATKIDLESDLQSINFTLKESGEFKNSLNGVINDEFGKPITYTPVIVYLVETDPYNSNALFVGRSSYTNGNGAFKIENLIPGQYIIYAYLRGNKYKPGYYNGSGKRLVQSWLIAKEIKVEESGDFGDIELNLEELKVGKTNQVAKGKVERLVSVAPGSTNASAPISGVQVLVTDPGSTVFNFSYSDSEGEFEVPNIGTDFMRIYFDKVGYKIGVETIDLHEGETVDDIIAILEPQTTTNVEDFESINATVFPNPSNGNISISGDFVPGEYFAKVVDMAGNTVLITEIELEKYSNTNLNLSNLNVGQYIINLYGNKQNYSTKITVIK